MIRECGRSARLEEFSKRRSQEGKLETLVVPANETRVLSYDSPTMRPYYVQMRVEDIRQLKDLIGVPDEIVCRGLAVPADARIPARTIGAAVFSGEVAEEEKMQAGLVAYAAAERFIFGNSSEVSIHQDLINAYLKERGAEIFVPLFSDIIVENNATLQVAKSTLAVHANRVRMFGSGRIVCDGPTTFDCRSFEGNLPSGGSSSGNFAVVTGPVLPEG